MPHSAAGAQKKLLTVFGIYFKTRYFIKGNPVKLHIKAASLDMFLRRKDSVPRRAPVCDFHRVIKANLVAGSVAPGKEDLPHPFKLADGNIPADFLFEFAFQRFGVSFAEGGVTAGKGKPGVVRRLLKKYFSVLNTDSGDAV